MRHILLSPLLLVALGMFVGCHKPVVREKPLPDPLLTSKKSIEGRSTFREVSDSHEEMPLPPPPPAQPIPGGTESVVNMLGQTKGK